MNPTTPVFTGTHAPIAALRNLREEDFEAASSDQLLDAWQRNRSLVEEILRDGRAVPESISARGRSLISAAAKAWLEFAPVGGAWTIREQKIEVSW